MINQSDLFWAIGMSTLIYFMTNRNLFWTSVFLIIGAIILGLLETRKEENQE
jgi:cytochrome b561